MTFKCILDLEVCPRQCLDDSELKDDSMSDAGDCITAPAAPGLLNID